jgi:hypothetical protein
MKWNKHYNTKGKLYVVMVMMMVKQIMQIIIIIIIKAENHGIMD